MESTYLLSLFLSVVILANVRLCGISEVCITLLLLMRNNKTFDILTFAYFILFKCIFLLDPLRKSGNRKRKPPSKALLTYYFLIYLVYLSEKEGFIFKHLKHIFIGNVPNVCPSRHITFLIYDLYKDLC